MHVNIYKFLFMKNKVKLMIMATKKLIYNTYISRNMRSKYTQSRQLKIMLDINVMRNIWICEK